MALNETSASRVEVAGVDKRYEGEQGPVQALEDVSFTVEPGEFVCLVGPSGCGKTTLFRIVAGLEEPTAGSVSLDGRQVSAPNASMGIVFQEYHLFPWLTVSENVAFGLKKQGVPKEERVQRVHDLIELVGLEGFADTYPKSLSGGMKQRVALARALAVDPDLLLMDEPFSAVDAQTRATLQEELLEIWAETGKTILFVTHDVEEAVRLGDRVLVMGKNPNTIAEVVEIDAPRPRSRSHPAVGEYYEIVRDLIRE